MNIRIASFVAVTALLTGLNAMALDWPQWRGPDRNDVSKETDLLRSWPEGGPKKVWTYDRTGLGYAGYSIADGRLLTMGARGNEELLIALDAATGRELWATKMGGLLNNNWGDGPRGTPTVDGDRVYSLGGLGDLVCARAQDGKILWQVSMSDFGGRKPNWGYCESVLVDGDRVVCTPGGSKGAIVALDKATGKLIWQSSGFTEGAQYASVVTAHPNGQKQYVQMTMNKLVAVAPDSGRVLWTVDWPRGRTAVIPTPIVQDNFVYISSGYGAGCMLVEIGRDHSVRTVYDNRVMKNHHGGVLLHEGHLYGYSDGVGWTCQNFKSGEEVWSERRALRKGAAHCADGMLYCLDETSGTVVLAEASTKGWKEHGRFKITPQSEQRSPKGRVWTHPVVANGRLYLRDQEFIHCYEVKVSRSASRR